ALRFDVAVGNLRLVGRGPELFAEDQRVLNAFAAAAQAAYEARELSTRAGEARDLAVMDRQRTALLAAVGHDLRTPLAGIKAAEKVRVEVAEDLPLVQADPGLLERVFVNLIDNAVRYGGDAEVSASAGEFSAKVLVRDHGPGVPDEQREHLFEPFKRLGDRGGPVNGTGLGLSVARGFTEAMGGTLIADRDEDGGLVMRMRLPLAGKGDE